MSLEADHRKFVDRESLSVFEFSRFTSRSARLLDANGLDEMLNAIYEILPELGIKTFFLALYKKEDKPLEYSRLMLAMHENRKTGLDPLKLDFKTGSLLPAAVYPSEGRNNFIIHALHQRNENIGFIILNLEEYLRNISLYDELCMKISSNIRLIMLIDKITQQTHFLSEEIKERKSAEKKLKRALAKLEKYNLILHDLSLKDELTGLYNRRGFLTLGGQYLNYAKRNNKEFVLFYCDMDGLKKINDSYGHKEGDSAIKKTAMLLQKSFRSIDIIARIGGDEFTVLAADCSREDAELLKKRLSVIFQNHNAAVNKPYKISISSGTIFVDHSVKLDFNELMAIADKKLYEDKGKNTGL